MIGSCYGKPTPRPVFAAVKQKVKLTVSIKKPMQSFDCIGFLLTLIYRSILELRFDGFPQAI